MITRTYYLERPVLISMACLAERALYEHLNSYTVPLIFEQANIITVMDAKLGVHEARISKLTNYRNLFGLLALCLVMVAVAFPFWSLPYEPIMALLLAVLGTFVVFVMKVADAA